MFGTENKQNYSQCYHQFRHLKKLNGKLKISTCFFILCVILLQYKVIFDVVKVLSPAQKLEFWVVSFGLLCEVIF